VNTVHSYLPYLILVVVPMLLGLWAQSRVHSAYRRASAIPASSGFTGAQTAEMILKAHGVTGVTVEPVGGQLTDHYDPRTKVLRLSQPVYAGRSVAALGIAAHEAGHALQDADHYAPLKLRNGIVPLAAVGSRLFMVTIVGAFLALALAPRLGVILLGIAVVMLLGVVIASVVTLPVEFNASRRARELLTGTGIVSPGPESREMSAVLSAAALTYVAGTVAAIGTLLYYLMMFLGASGSGRR
jgi:Zn-dependent membrane protease YugP